MSQSSVPRLDLAPKLKRPLSLWNPLDYLRLLYWVFFFPQALRWYEECYFPNRQERSPRLLRQKLLAIPQLRNLIIQTLVVTLTVCASVGLLLPYMGIEIYWSFVFLSLLSGISLSVIYGIEKSASSGVIASVSFGAISVIAGSVAPGLPGSIYLNMSSSLEGGVVSGVIVGFLLVTMAIVISSNTSSVAVSMVGRIVGLVVIGVTFSAILGAAISAKFGVIVGMTFCMASIVTFDVVAMRLIDWLICSSARTEGIVDKMLGHAIWLPLPNVYQQLEQGLIRDWNTGVYNCNQLLAYSMQFITRLLQLKK